jgi:hypothetical protein
MWYDGAPYQVVRGLHHHGLVKDAVYLNARGVSFAS